MQINPAPFARSLACAAVVAAAASPAIAQQPDYRGNEFVLGFMSNFEPVDSLDLFITGSTATDVTVSAPGVGFGPVALTVTPGELTAIELPSALAPQNTSADGAIVPHGVLVESDEEVVVYGLNQKEFTTDAMLGIPTDVLGTEYWVMSYAGNIGIGDSKSEFMVVATEDGTRVEVELSDDIIGGTDVPALTAGDTFTVTLDRLESLQIATPPFPTNGDLTGTRIVASAPVAVFSGHTCANVPIGAQFCDHLVEQLPPVNTWGDDFLVASLETRRAGDRYRVLSATDGNAVDIDGTIVATLDAGEFHEAVLPSNSAIEILTSGPAIVAQFSQGGTLDSTNSDPFMMLIPPTQQFANDYTISTPDSFPVAFDNYVSIVIDSDASEGLRLDGEPIDEPFEAISDTGFAVARVPIEIGGHNIRHLSPTVPFGIYVYGFADDDSYGYPGGLRLVELEDCVETPTVVQDGLDNDCDQRVDEELGNGIDDDGDGRIDEDLATAPPPTPLACDIDADSDIDRVDIGLIFGARNQASSGPDDPRDADRNGTITVLDARRCVLACTLPRCVSQ